MKYAADHPQSPKAPEALYNAAWRYSALIQIYKSDNQDKKAADSSARSRWTPPRNSLRNTITIQTGPRARSV